MIIDKPLAELEQYKPLLTRQHDFDAFWEQTRVSLQWTRRRRGDPRRGKVSLCAQVFSAMLTFQSMADERLERN